MRDVRVDTVDDPEIHESRDAIIRVTSTAICGSDLHIYNGSLPQPTPQTLGHEFMGIVEEVGKGVTNLQARRPRGGALPGGLRPLPVSATTTCPATAKTPTPTTTAPKAASSPKRAARSSATPSLYGGYDGGQAEYVRVPYADFGPRKVPDFNLTDEQVLFLTDIFPTGYSGIDWANVKGGETIAIFGAGPVGIMAAKSAWLRGAAKRVIIVDTQQYRLDMAKKSAKAETILWESHKQVVDEIRSMSGGYAAPMCASKPWASSPTATCSTAPKPSSTSKKAPTKWCWPA